MDPVRHLRFSVAALVSVIALGTLGYATIEDWRAFDALYMTIITLATVGFKEVHELGPDSRMTFNLRPEKNFDSNPELIILSSRPAISRLEAIAGGKQS